MFFSPALIKCCLVRNAKTSQARLRFARPSFRMFRRRRGLIILLRFRIDLVSFPAHGEQVCRVGEACPSVSPITSERNRPPLRQSPDGTVLP